MAEENTKFGEQAINKIAQVALARQIKDVEQIQVQVKANLNQLARGEVESIAIALQNLLLHHTLRAELLHLEIGLVAVKPFSALRGKIQLVQPSEGSLQLVIQESALTDALNAATFREQLSQRLTPEAQQVIQSRLVQCSLLSQESIVFRVVNPNADSATTFTATPGIRDDRQAVELHDVRSHNQNLPLEFIDAFAAQVGEVLNLREFSRQGMTLQIQQLQIAMGKLTLQAAARIEKFPS